MSIQAYVLHGIEDLRLESRQTPPLTPRDVLVDVKRVGICGSDVHYYRQFRIGQFVPRKPLVLGHEFAGDVIAVGKEVTRVAVGDRVTAEPSIECRQCRYCRSGRYNLCTNLRFIGTAATIPHIDGAFGEQLVVPESHCHRIDERLDYAAGALAEPLAVAAHAVLRAGSLAGARILVTGGGTIGQMVLAMARVMGGADITMADLDAYARRFALQHGAVAAFDPGDDAAPATRAPDGYDVIFEASGAPAALALAYAAAARGGRIVQIGTQPAELTLPANLVMSKELTVVGSFRYAHVFPLVLELMAAGRIAAGDLISAVYPFGQMQEAMRRAVAKKEIVKVQVSREKE
ncbi:MAG: alcohol dehydrogenase catalytic domain-containing protein [Spirochaetales bacterium]|nr:alcohol dehydrogenase catalytic domain-containing protein [Spirochaetales bacterium]